MQSDEVEILGMVRLRFANRVGSVHQNFIYINGKFILVPEPLVGSGVTSGFPNHVEKDRTPLPVQSIYSLLQYLL